MKRLENDVVVSGVAYDDDLLKVTIYNIPHVPGIAAKVFTALAPESELPRLEREVRIVSLKNEGDGRVLLRYVADSPAVAGSELAEPRLEDLYLWLFQAERGQGDV